MTKSPVHKIGALQLKILKHLWAHPDATVADVHAAVGARDALAYTTIATMLRKMEARGLVAHRVEGRTFLYSAEVSSDEVSGSMAHDILDRVFQGSVSAMFSHLLSSREISRKEIETLEKLIQEKKGRKHAGK
jgi:predicted transcriptional regulator